MCTKCTTIMGMAMRMRKGTTLLLLDSTRVDAVSDVFYVGLITTASPGRQLLNADVILIVWDRLHVHVPSPWGRLTDETLTGSRV